MDYEELEKRIAKLEKRVMWDGLFIGVMIAALLIPAILKGMG